MKHIKVEGLMLTFWFMLSITIVWINLSLTRQDLVWDGVKMRLNCTVSMQNLYVGVVCRKCGMFWEEHLSWCDIFKFQISYPWCSPQKNCKTFYSITLAGALHWIWIHDMGTLETLIASRQLSIKRECTAFSHKYKISINFYNKSGLKITSKDRNRNNNL